MGYGSSVLLVLWAWLRPCFSQYVLNVTGFRALRFAGTGSGLAAGAPASPQGLDDAQQSEAHESIVSLVVSGKG